MLHAISPIDGRYENKTKQLQPYFSEFGLIKERVFVEIQYLIALSELGLDQLTSFSDSEKKSLQAIADNFSEADAITIKEIEKVTNHDVKAVEYFVKEKLVELGLKENIEWVHFGLTSQDINNTAIPRLIKNALQKEIIPTLNKVVDQLLELAKKWKGIPLLAHTHGQPASPTTVGKEMMVFVQRLQSQIETLKGIPIYGKFGGATGNFNAHYIAFPVYNWMNFGDNFVKNYLEIDRLSFTTQIDHYDHLADMFHTMMRINTIWLDLARDFWTYISMEFFGQKTIAGEIGSSAMPHKVNPIDFENAEGNLGMANAIFTHLAAKLPISRLQRDLTDSTVLRNVGVPFAHSIIALISISKGLSKVKLNEHKIKDSLNNNWAVLAEAIQNILRREGFEKPYEMLKELTRGKGGITKESLHAFINQLDISDKVKQEMLSITPFNYIGKHPDY